MYSSFNGADNKKMLPARSDKWKLEFVKKFLSFQNGILNFLVWLLYKKQAEEIKSILIFRTGSLGDNICASPSIDAIRRHYPKARITILTDASTAYHISMINVLDPHVYNEIIDYLGMDKKKLIRILKEKKFDLVIQLSQRDAAFKRLLRDIIFFRLVAKSGWGWEVSTLRYFKKTQEKFIVFLSETEKLLKNIKENGISVPPFYSYPLNITASDELLVYDAFKQNHLENREIIAVVAGSQRPCNRWPINYFKEVVELFSKKYAVILIGGKTDTLLVASLEEIPGVVNFCGHFTPMQSAFALKKCILTLSNDTGPMHLSYAVETPVVSLFSSRDFGGRWFPPDNGYNKVFRTENVHCSICFTETCTNNICMQAIKPVKVIEVMNVLLNKLAEEKEQIPA